MCSLLIVNFSCFVWLPFFFFFFPFDSHKEASLKGLCILKAAITGIEPGAIKGELLGQDKRFVEFFEGVISLMAQSPNAVQRDSAYRSFAAALTVFDDLGRFTLLRDLLARCPFPIAKSVLITLTKDTIHRGWAPGSIFAGPRVLELVSSFLRLEAVELKAMDLLHNLDIYITSANLYVFLIMRDTFAVNQTGIWSAAHVEVTRAKFITPLKSGVLDLRREIEDETARVRKEKPGPQDHHDHSHGHSHGHGHGHSHDHDHHHQAGGDKISPEDKLKVLHEQEFNVFALETAIQRIEETWAKHLSS